MVYIFILFLILFNIREGRGVNISGFVPGGRGDENFYEEVYKITPPQVTSKKTTYALFQILKSVTS